MAIYDDTVKKYKQYLKDAQIEALMEQSRQYNRENAGNRADAVSQARSDYDTAYRGLQNMGLAGAKGTEITGEVPRLKTNIAGQFNRVNAQLYNREQQAVEALGGQYAAQTKAQQAAEAAARASAASQVESEEAAKRNAVGGLVTGAVSAALAGQTKPNANTATLIPSKGQRTGMETAAKARGTGGMVTAATAAAIAQQEFEQKKALAAMQALGIRRSKFASSPTQKTAAKTTVNALQSSQAAQQEYLSAMEMLRRAQAGAQKDPRAGSGVAYYADKVGEILSNATIPTEQRVQMAMEYLQADVDEKTSPLADRKAKEIIARAYGLKVPKSDETFDALDKARRSKTGGLGYGVGATYDKDAEIAFRQEQSNRAEYNYYMPAIANKIRYAGKTGKVNDKETDFVYNVINGKITEETLKKLYGRSDPGTKYRYLLLDEEEKNAYNYLYEKKGLKAANNYADSLMPLLEMRGAEADKAAWEEYTKEHPVAANIHSVGLSAAEIAPAISRIGIGAYNEISGTKNPAYVDTNSTLYSGTNRRTTIRTKTSGMILGDNPTGWQKVKNFAYNTGMSMADSATMLPFAYAGLPWVSDLVFFSSASNEAYKDAISRGANQADAILAGAASGIAEALFEHVSLDKVVKMSTSGKGKFIMNILKQAGIEASEEACTSIANLITDKLFLGELSNNELDRKNYIQEYMATGMSREEAEKKANIQVFTDTIKDIGMDALGGFASGLGFGLFGAATNAYTQKQIGKEVKQNREVLDNDYRVAELLGGETADLARKYDQRSITEMEAGDLHTAIVSKLQEQAEVSEKNAETVAAVLDGREISADQAADMLQSSKDFLQEAGYDTSSAESLAASYNQRVEEVATAQKEAFDNRARDYNIKRAEEVYTDKEALRNVPLTLPTGVSPVQFAEAERSNFKSRTTIQSDGVELQLSLMDMDGRFTNEQKLERARKAMTAQAQRKLDMIGKISKALGMDVVVHDYMRGSNGYFGEDGKIHFVLSGHMSVARVAAHELTHQMQSVASEKYTVVRDQLIEDVGQDRFDRLLKRKAAQYGYNMESEQGRLACDEEVIAELCEGMLSDKDRLERFAERHTDTALTLKDRLTKILNAIHATLKDTFGQNQNRISDMITDEKTADKWLDGLDEVLKRVQEKQQAKEVKYSIETDGPYSYVKADRQVFTSSNIDTRKVQLENYLNSIIDYTGRLEIPTMDGEVIAITDASTGRTNSVGKLSSYNEHVNKETGEVNAKKVRLKQNIALHIDEVIAVSQKAEGIGTVTDRNFKHDAASQKGWTYRNAAFEDFDGKRYAFLISVPENDTGKFVYNVNKFKERAVKTKRPSSEKITGLSLSGAQTEESLNSYYAQNKESVKGKFSLDEAYRKAVSSGNVQEQQKLVEQAAKEAGYTKLFYHGSKKGGGFTTFKNWQYFTENKQYAQRYAGGENGLYTTYVKMENPFDTRQAEARSLFNEARQELGLSKLQENGLPDWTDGYDLSEYIEENDLPYDSIILDEGGDMVNGKPVSRGLSYVIRNPEQIKSADAVTYDDAGNVIPLSERFNMGKKDIRYSLDTEQLEKTVRAIDTKALEEGLQSMTLTSNVNSFTMKDPSRFFDAISKNNTELRDELHDIFEKPHSEATGKYARGIKDMQERVRNIATEAGILSKDGKKFDKAASAAVQNYGEGYQLKKCTVEAKVVDADTVFINAVSDGINVLSGDFTLQEVRKNFGRENGDMIWEKAFDQAQKNSERGQKASAIEYESTTSPYKLTDLQTQFPRTWQKLVEADKSFREMYDEYIGNMNAMLREIYPNSFTKEDDTVAKIDDLVEKKKHRITDTEKAIAERMKSLGKVEAEMAAKKRTDTKAYDTLRRRQTALNEAIADLNEKKAGYNEDIAALAVKKNAIFELDKSGESLNRMHQLEYRQDYYHHFNEMSVGLKEAWNLILQGSNRDISPAVVGNTANSKAKTRWAGFFQQRKGGAYTADAVNGMLKYGALAEYKLAFDPLVAYLRDAEKKIRDVSDETNRNSLILYLNSWTNQIAGKSSDFDRLLTDRGVVGRNILNFLQKLNGRVIRNTLYFNARSAIVQISNISNAVSLVTNPKDWKNGVLCWSKAAKGDEMMQNIMSQSNFLASRFAGVEMMDTSTMAKAERFANWMLSIADTISAKATWWAAYNQYVRNPNSKSIMSMPRKYESAVDYADDVTRRTHGGRGVGEKAPIMTSKLVSFFAPFQLEVNNTYQLLKENIKKKNALGIATMEATVFAMNAVFEAIVGSTVLPFDFVRALIDILFGAKDILDDDDDDHKLASTFKLIGQRIGAETVSGLPYAGMIPQFLGEDTTEAVFGETDMTKYGNVNMGVGGAVGIGKVLASLAKWGAEGVKPDWFSMVNELSEVLPPIGGKQIARTIGGLTTVAQGYSGKTNSKGEDTVQFATDTNVLNYLHAGIFGKWALTEASEYFGEDRILPKLFGYYNGESASAGSPVKAEEFHAARALGLSGKGYFTIRKELKEYRTQEGKRSSLYTTNLTPAQKAGMDALLISTTGTSSEAKSEGAIVYGRTKQEDGSWGEWKVKADYSSEGLFKLSLYGDTKYSAGTTAMKNGAGIKNVLGLLDTVDAYNDANENPMTATQKRDWLRENVKDTKQAALLDAYILSKNKSTNVKVEGNVVYTMSLGEDGKPSVTKDGTVAEWKVRADYTDDTWYAISRYGDSKYRKGLTAVRKGANPKTIRKYLDDMQAYQDSKNQSMSFEERGQWIRRNGGTPKEQAILDAYMLRKDSNTDAKVKDGIVYTLELGEDGKPKVYKSGSVAEWKVKADYTSDEWYAVSQTDHYDKAKTAYSACGIKPTVFVDFYAKWSDLSAKDASGKTVSGLKKKRTKELLDKMKISTEQKAYLYYKVCGYK